MNDLMIDEALKKQSLFFEAGKTKNISFRIKQLKNLRRAVMENEEDILAALQKDMGKASFEAYLTEITLVLEEIRYTLQNIRKWSKRQKVKTPLINFLSRSYLYPEPYGVVLIIGPWNYPFQLIFAPLIGAMVAGNCAVLKPSEFTTHTSELIGRLVGEYFDEGFVTVIEGDKETNQKLLAKKFDYIFFTGSINVGKIVMKAAAEHLTPVTLELGGKSPCIVDSDSDLNSAATKIAWGKFVNAGQTCIAPDYVYVHSKVKQRFIVLLKDSIVKFYGDNPQQSSDYPRIINQTHFHRLMGLLKKGTIRTGGETNEQELYMAPTIIDNVTWNDPVMQEEIFGPVLPILEYSSLNEVTDAIKKFNKPLALYLFTNNKKTEREVLHEASFGGGCVNNIFMHLSSPHLPFGGVGASGMGAYHGKASFDTFSHYKSILKSSTTFDLQSVKYPPYKNRLPLLKKAMRLRK